MLNANMPPIECFLNESFMYNGKSHNSNFCEATIFAVCGLPGQAPLFHCMTDFGAVWFRLPISAFCWKIPDDINSVLSLDELCLWNSFSYSPVVNIFDYLAGLRCEYRGKDNVWRSGNYMLTIDWCNANGEFGFAETPNEYKCHHMIKLDNGQFALQPNNRIRWFEPAFVVEEFPEKPEFKVNTRTWSVEDSGLWKTEASQNFMYSTEKAVDD